MNALEALQSVQRNEEALERIANRALRAYCENVGEAFAPINRYENAEAVGQSIAALPALVSAIQLVLFQRYGYVDGQLLVDYLIPTLDEIAGSSDTDDDLLVLVELFANATWAAQQPLRTDRGPFARATRMNIWATLDQEEKDKDWVQIQAVCFGLLEELQTLVS